MHSSDFSEPRRQELLGVAVIFADNLRKFGRAVFAFLVYAAFQKSVMPYMFGAAAVALVLIAVFTWLQYRRFVFYVKDRQLIINKGVFTRERIAIPFERIQTVHLHQNLVQQLIQLTGVKVDTAGSKGSELEIKALSKKDALALQEVLEAEKQQVRSVPNEVGGEVSEVSVPKIKEQKEVLVKLSLWQLLQVGLTQNHIRNGFIALGVLWGWASQFNFFSDDEMEAELGRYATEGIQWGMYMITAGAVIFIIGSIVISLVQSILKYFNLKAFLSSKAVHVNAGLLKRNEYTIPIQKIQFIEWYDNFLRRIPGFEMVRIYQGQSEDSEAKQRVEIPACYKDQTDRIMGKLFPESFENEHSFSVKAHWTQFLVLFMIFALPVTIGVGLAGYFSGKMILFLVLGVYLPLTALFSWKFYRSVELYTNGKVLIYKRGWLFSKRTVLKMVKVQNVAWSQTIFQRRRGTAHLHLHTAAGSRSIRFLPAGVVKELHNYLLYRVETFEGKWM